MQDIPNYDSFTQIRPIRKGWSGEEKYYIETREGERLFLRLADAGELGRKQLEFALLEQAHALGVPMPKPLNVGLCREGRRVYSLFTWCEGEDAEEVLPSLSEAEQYQLGLRAGEHLRLLHAVPVPQGMASWEEHFNRKLDRKLKQYADCPLSFAGDTHVLRYLEENRQLLAGRPRCFQHGDYHVGNMVIGGAGLSVIDFNRFDFGDPWEEFNRIVFSAAASPKFAKGQIDGYFGGEPPLLFFQLMAFYIAANTLGGLPWAVSYGEQEVEYMTRQAADVLSWFANMTNPVPAWYA